MAPGKPSPPAPVEGRYYALDALRAWAMLCGVAFHAAISYMHGQMPGLLWGVHDTTRSRLLDGVFWWIHGFHLHLFFLISGFAAVMLWQSRGAAGFLRQRVQRLLVPFVLSVATILTVTLYVWAVGWFLSGRCTLRELLRTNFKPEIRHQMWGPAHLWFLEELLVMSLVFAGVYALASRVRRGPREAPAAAGPLPRWFQPLVLALPTAAYLWLQSSPVMTHTNSFVPDVARMGYYGLFFAAGAWLHGHRHKLDMLAPQGLVWLALSAPALAATLWLVPHDLRLETAGWQRAALAAALALLAWTSVFGFLGLFLARLNRPSALVRYLADASYWIYLCHFPVVGLAQAALYKLPLAAEVKFLLVLAAGLLIGLGSYQVMVRHTWIGALLHGRRPRLVLRTLLGEHQPQELQQQKAA